VASRKTVNNLKDSIIRLNGVGEERADDLSQLGIRTIEDLLYYFPYKHEDQRLKDLAEVGHEEKVTVEGTIQSEPVVRFYGKKKSRMTVRLLVDRYALTAVLFNRHFAKKQFQPGKKVYVSGKLDKHRMQLSVQDYVFKRKTEEQPPGLQPVYSTGGKISQPFLRKLIGQALGMVGQIPEILPDELVERYRLMPRAEAVRVIHQPDDFEQFKWAKRRMVYEELFLFQLKIHALKRIQRERTQGVAQKPDQEQFTSFVQQLPFELTNAQQRALKEILADMRAPYAMNRLLQGDVGSGKTIVAALALFASCTAGYQGAVMVPTEILAEQHYHSLSSLFEDAGLQIALLTGSTKTKARREILAGLQMGLIDLVVGTHALIQDQVYFQRLGTVVIDEQHRFGVEQRRRLRQKGVAPDVLFMTATPIPRTLAITAFGEMDVSVIDELPKGRKAIETYWVKEKMFPRVLQFIEKEIRAGRQTYFICPLIEESEKLDVQNAIDMHHQLSQDLSEYSIGLLHGKMNTAEKEEVMKKFVNHEIDVLVSTTVVEVGVNVPNATLMVVQDAERFGLSQLHQLRGRVGRGDAQSYCILIADPKSELGVERMKIMKESNDGFELAQKDLEIRGPGDFFGTKQSGLPEFKLADMIHDYRVLEAARDDAAKLVQTEAFWQKQAYPLLHQYLERQGVFDQASFD
jgi:ATP-dependent DNA helicase RecG